jgi:hypothetical protein
MGASLAAAEVPDDGAAEGPTTRRTELPDGRVRVSGLVTPDGDRSFTLRNLDGRTTVRWSDPTQVALDVNYHQLEDLRDGAVRFQILREGGEVKIPLPAGPKYARKAVQPRQAAAALAEARKQRWLSARGVAIQCPPLADHLPTEAEPFFAGRWTFGQGRGKPAALAIGGRWARVCASGLGCASPLSTHPERNGNSHSLWYIKWGRVNPFFGRRHGRSRE